MKENNLVKRVISVFVIFFFIGGFFLNIVTPQPVLSVNVSGNTSVNMCEQYSYDITVQNTSTIETATNVVAVATIPDGFSIIDSGGGSVAGQQITWNIGTLDPLETWNTTITLEVTCNAVSGQLLVNITHDSGSSQGSIYLTVQPGAITITKTPSIIPAHIGDNVHWTLTVTSTGFGPVKNVVIEDTLGSGLLYDNVQTSPTPDSVVNNPDGTTTLTWNTISQLALMDPGDSVTIEVYADVVACSGLEDNAQASWGCGTTVCETESTKASVQLIVEEPEISYTLPDFTIPYCSSGTDFTIPITNSGTGTAHDFYLYVDFGSLSVSNVASPSGASYNNSEKRFEVGDIDPGTVNLTFTLTALDWCSASSGTLLFKPEYTDDCGNVFSPPWELSSYSITNIPSLSVTMTSSSPTVYLGENIVYNISASYSGPLNCGGTASNITVVDTIPDDFTIMDAGGGTINGNTIIWIVDPSTGLNTSITLQAPGYDQCETYCYHYATNTVTATMTDCCGCSLSASDSQTVALECQEYFDSDKTVSSAANFEKCTDLVYTNIYDFHDDPWWDDVNGTDFIFYEELNNNQEYVDGSLSVYVDGNPITGITVTYPDPQGRLKLDFSTSNFTYSPRNKRLTISYTLKTTDSSSPQCEGSYSFYDWSILDTGKTGGQCQPDQIIQETVYVTINSGQMEISIDTLPSIVETCGTYDVDINIDRTSTTGAYDVLVVLPLSNYDITVTGYSHTTPNVTTYSDRIEFEYFDYFSSSTTATIHAILHKRCGTSSDFPATVYWDEYCNNDDVPNRECSSTANDSPILVDANIFIKKTPELIYATANNVEWKIYVTNSGSGTAYNTWVEDVLGSDLSYSDSSVTDLNGTSVSVTTNVGEDHNGDPINGVTWIMDIPPGKTRVITLTADLIGCTDLDNDVTASWGCLDSDCQTPVTDHSVVAIPPSNAVTTNILPASIDLCGTENVTVRVKNAGITNVYNVETDVTLPPGLFYIPGTGSPTEPDSITDNPDGTQILVWQNIGDLSPAGEAGDTVDVIFEVYAGCDFPSGNRTVISKVSYDTVCGERKTSPESRSVLPVNTPHLTIQKDGRNITTAQINYTNTVNAEPGDIVEWRIQISNDGDITAHNVEFWDLLPSNMTLSSGPGLPGSGTQADPWIHGDLNVGETATYYIQATVDVNGCTDPPTTNTACAWYGCDDNPATTDIDPCRMPQVCDNGRLRTTSQFNINQTLGTITTCEGDITITVHNLGPKAYNVVITSFLPSGFIYDSMISGPDPTPDPPTDLTQPVWIIGNMDEGDTVVLHFKMITDGSCNTVTPSQNTVHVDFDNYCGEHYTRTNSANVSPLMAVLNVTKTPEHQNYPPGETATWTITVTNTGNYQAENVKVVDVLSDNLINIVANNGSGGEVPIVIGNTVTWILSNPIPVGGTWTATLSADITGLLGTDTVTVNGYCSTGCIYSTATDTAWVHAVEGLYKSPDLQTATIGEEVTFDIFSSYWGTSNYENVLIIDTLPAGLEYVSSTYSDSIGLSPTPTVVGQTVTWSLGDFTGPNTAHITLTARVQNIPANFNGVVLTNWAWTTGTENGVPFDLSDSGDVQIIEPNLTIDKEGSISAGLPGDTVHYTITVQNTGTSPAYDVTIEDAIPPGLILDPSSITSTPPADNVSVVGNTITWKYNIIPVGSSVILEYDETIPPEGGVFTDTATVTDYSSLPGDNPYERHYSPVDDSWTVEAPGTDILKITLNTNINVPSPGGIVYFQLTITNTGSMPLDPVKLIDTVPDGLTYLSGTSIVDGNPYEPDTITDNPDGTQTLTWLNIGHMDPGDTIVVTFQATVDPGRIGVFVNRALVVGTSTIGDVSDEDDSPVGVKAPAIRIVKTVDKPSTFTGDTVTFTLRVTNTGEVPLDPVEVVDTLPVGLTYADEADPVPDTVTVNPDNTTTVIWNNIGRLEIGETAILKFKCIFNGDETTSINEAEATGTPPNGFPVYDDDKASVTASFSTYIWKVLSFNGIYRCQLCGMEDLFRRAREMKIEFLEDRDKCCKPYDLIEALEREILERGLDNDPRYENVLELLEYSSTYCDNALNAYNNGNYIESYRWSAKKCEAIRKAIEYMLDILSSEKCGCGG